jgi:hypothetical protein
VNGLLTRYRLQRQSLEFAGTGGVSAANRSLGFAPAFLDSESGEVYPSRFTNGLPAPFHLLEGLPESLWRAKDNRGRPTAVKSSLVPGFSRNGRFFTRAEAARLLAATPPVRADGHESPLPAFTR